VGYFSPIRELAVEVATAAASGWEYAWILFFTLATYINAGWLREQVCMYMCPYARFQSVMFDHDTLVVSYDRARGEPRGSRKRGGDPRDLGLGDCIDCELCVQVCPTGIDIRNGLQYQCITCALCVDACDSVMDKMGYRRGLIRYTTENALLGKPSRVLRPRLIGYTLAVLAMITLFTVVLLGRATLGIDALRERGQLWRETDGGMIENVYTLKLRNMAQHPRRVRLSLEGVPGLALVGEAEFGIAAGDVLALPVAVRAPAAGLVGGSASIRFQLEALDGTPEQAMAESRFLAPAAR
jgi:cytochrome c oxidase accessory protein FixG